MISQTLLYTLLMFSVLCLILSILLPIYFSPKNVKKYPLKEEPLFSRFLGCGFELSNFIFRKKGNKYVRYSFFYLFWIPIIPDACYGIEEICMTYRYKKLSTHMHITHQETKSKLEILSIYLASISMVGILYSLFMIFIP